MADKPSEPKNATAEPPSPEVLKPRAIDGSGDDTPAKASEPKPSASASRHQFRARYHISHRATFIGLAVVVLVLVINAGIIFFVINRQSDEDSRARQGEVVISQEALEGLGVNRDTIGELGVELIVSPNARFDNAVKVGGNVSIDGELRLNNSFNASGAVLGQLEAGSTSLTDLNVNGSASLTNASVRNDLTVTGTTRLQGPVTVTQLLTANGSVNVSGNLTVGGSLSIATLNTNSLIVNNTFTVGGHIITRGSAPSITGGTALGSNGTVSISGNDQAGTVAVNIGVGASSGTVASVTFRSRYASTPRVVITPVGNVGSFYISRNSSGFSILVGSGLSPGGYAFDYIVMQ